MPPIHVKPPLLVVDDKSGMRDLLSDTFSEQGFAVSTACDGAEAISLLDVHTYDVVVTDLKMPEKDGLEVLRAVKSKAPDTQVIIVTAYGTMDTAVEAMRLGAYDFVTKPFKLAEMELKVQKSLRERRERVEKRAPSPVEGMRRRIVGESEATRRMLNMVGKIGPSKSTVLIRGATGTGKELVARAIHDASPRRDQAFVALNCAALAPGILESELFGHEKGAFTGATDRRQGRFERADGGTLFLDEVGEIDPGTQVKLLRALEEGEVERVGGTQTIKVDVRVVAATNRDLRKAIAEGQFREDFFYRLNVFSIDLEPLRNRRDDIPSLIDHFLSQYSEETDKQVTEVNDDVMEIFMTYSWPGNVRELENVIERAVVLAEGPVITREGIPPELYREQQTAPGPEAVAGLSPAPEAGNRMPPPVEGDTLEQKTETLESQLILRALDRFRWNKTKAADHLGLKRTTLQYKIRKYGLE